MSCIPGVCYFWIHADKVKIYPRTDDCLPTISYYTLGKITLHETFRKYLEKIVLVD